MVPIASVLLQAICLVIIMQIRNRAWQNSQSRDAAIKDFTKKVSSNNVGGSIDEFTC